MEARVARDCNRFKEVDGYITKYCDEKNAELEAELAQNPDTQE